MFSRNSASQNDRLFKLAMELEKIALEDPYFVEKKLYPNVDFYSGIVQKAIGIPTEMFHLHLRAGPYGRLDDAVEEMITDPEYKIGRPRQLYIGAAKRDVVPLAKRAKKEQGRRWTALSDEPRAGRSGAGFSDRIKHPLPQVKP